MNNYWKLLSVLIFMVLLSCRSSQDLIYLKDTSNEELLKGLSEEYVLKNGDILYVSIKSMNPEVNLLFNPESAMESNMGQGYLRYTSPSGAYLYGYEIDKNGDITLPMLGKLKVSGINISEVESVVQKKADEYLNDAIVKVKLLNFKITVLGEVRSPNIFYNYNNSLTVLEAIAMSSGNTDFASIKKVMVVRITPEGRKTYMLDLSSKNVYASEAYYLQPNDYVIVQPDKYKNFQLNSQAYSLMFSSISILLAVLGFVIN